MQLFLTELWRTAKVAACLLTAGDLGLLELRLELPFLLPRLPC